MCIDINFMPKLQSSSSKPSQSKISEDLEELHQSLPVGDDEEDIHVIEDAEDDSDEYLKEDDDIWDTMDPKEKEEEKIRRMKVQLRTDPDSVPSMCKCSHHYYLCVKH